MLYYLDSAPGSNTWTNPQTIATPGASLTGSYEFGLALSSDGQTAVIGAHTANKVFVSTFSGSSFPTATELVPAGVPTLTDFGQSVAVSANGGVVLAGAPGTNFNDGAALYFMLVGTSYAGMEFVPRPPIAPIAGTAGKLGAGVAISGDGLSAAAGQPAASAPKIGLWFYS